MPYSPASGLPRRRGMGLLDLPTIVDVALGIARTDGMSALSMRRIADELGRSPMALYRHVADRQSLVLAMLDTVAARIEIPAPVEDPRSEITVLMHAVHTAAQYEPWIVTALAQEGLASPRIVPVIDRILAAFGRSGLQGAAALSANMLLWEFAYGELLTSHQRRPGSWGRAMMRGSDPERFPALHAAIREADRAPGEPQPELFGPHLQTVLDGLLGPTPETGEPR
ncbi:TetR/AcrR family transcriptional regulator [Pseudonocardia sp. P1]|nr:Transcriptional regulator, TetR family [Pseudonocardia sp. Ae707_Ps1]